ncbi:16976_t:CDS:2, partial [Gigaspora rosea]
LAYLSEHSQDTYAEFCLNSMNGFYESIWKEQCRLIGLWEKEKGITIKEKRKKSTMLLNDSEKGIEEKSRTAISLWQVAVKSYIQSGEIPFWAG